MLNSFRLRLALWSALLAGVALAGFMLIAWWQLRDSKLAAIDTEMHAQAERELSRPWPLEHWQHHAQSLAKSFASDHVENAVLLFKDRRGAFFQSEYWPAQLDSASLPWPAMSNQHSQSPRPSVFEEPDFARPFPPPEHGFNPAHFPPPSREPPRMDLAGFQVVTVSAGDGVWRFGLAVNANGDQLAIGINLQLVDQAMHDLRNAFLLATPLALVFIGLGAWLLSARALRPIRELTNTMSSLTAKALDQRLAFAQHDREFSELIQVFNGMLERLQRSFLQASRFSADAAHELKTPLAILQGQIEQAIGLCADGSASQTTLTTLLDEVQHLNAITRKLLLLSLADAGRLQLHLKPIDLSRALLELQEDTSMLAPQLQLTATIAPDLTMYADAELLWQVLHNLISNAIKYNMPQGWLHIAAAKKIDTIEISITNATLGIAEADQERIFERFYRVDQAHNRSIEGVGLGLSISREIIRAHQGELTLDNRVPGQARFVINLPLS